MTIQFKTNEGDFCEIVKKLCPKKVLIKFIGYEYLEVEVYYANLLRGKVKNPLRRSVYGAGYLGVGKYMSSVNGIESLAYQYWKRVLERNFCSKKQLVNPSYIDCSVSEEFTCYQDFAKWFEEQPFFERGWEIDKDLLLKGNKIYSPENCCLIPREINGSLNNKRKSNSHLPIGVSNNGSGKYTSKRNFGGLQKHLGTFKTIEEAFFAYKTEKESYIKELAYKWKDQIDPRAYNALMSWEVNIDD